MATETAERQQSTEQTRARYPDEEGYVERDGVRLFYEVYGDGDPTILLLPTWSIIHSRCWKAQIPYLARHFRVVTFDGRGNGKSDRPEGADAYAEPEFAADALAVMDATGTDSAFLVAMSLGAQRATLLGAEHPGRVNGIVYGAPALPVFPMPAERQGHPFDEPQEAYEGWAKFNRHYWAEDFRGFLEFFFSKAFTEPHSTKQIEDCVGWGLDTTPETLADTAAAAGIGGRDEALELRARVQCPVLVIHGDADELIPYERGQIVAEATGGTLVTVKDGGHNQAARNPVRFNLLTRDLVAPRAKRDATVHRADARKRALFVSSPIGLGHAQRDVAIARELRQLVPDLQIDWLAQDPVTRVLADEGESIHPASEHLASESGHFESESAEHDLQCFQSFRRMDEILVANFMLFHDVVTADPYDLWIADEGWEIDYFLHENPNLKAAEYAWLTDFVGFLPMADGGEREAFLTADHNAQMVEHIAALPGLRDRSLLVGAPEDIVDERLGPDLPMIREWTEQNFDFTGYITGFDPAQFADREALRAELGYATDEQVCVVTVGGSGVGESLLRRVIAAYPEAKRRTPALRMIVVAGPRIDPGRLPAADGLEVRPYVHNLYRHLAACDLAVAQGGLTTSMELTANRRPFIYFPLKHHFEQHYHVHHRLQRYGAGRRMDFDESPPDAIAEAIEQEIGRDVDYRPVEADGARRAALRLAEML